MRNYLVPLLPNKGYAICRQILAKFQSEDLYLTKLNILYLINDLLAYSKNHYSGFPLFVVIILGFIECVKSYIELMLHNVKQCQELSDQRISQLVSIWEQHGL